MSVDQAISNIPDEIMNYLMDQRKRERDAVREKEVIKERIKKLQDILNLLEDREGGLTCTISSGNIYQQSTVQKVRDRVSANISINTIHLLEAHDRLLIIQENLNRDYEMVCDNVNRIGTAN
ncbi:uncharacterized protein LOC108107695 [Drosophila eugracilis]|uniref:uncharacterized protein LOC108107695 n=1 Tax=Drosophila eugracilis TaxID=29029 RepID=UPI0007E61853|nr:uncharacterized protein LOC108107695 [Drosophila eugracilis]